MFEVTLDDVNAFISLTLNQPNYLMTPFILKKIIFLMFLSVFLMPLSTTEWTLTNSKSSGLGIWSSKILCRNIKNQGPSFCSPCVVHCKISQFNEKKQKISIISKPAMLKTTFHSPHRTSGPNPVFCFFCFLKWKKKKVGGRVDW